MKEDGNPNSLPIVILRGERRPKLHHVREGIEAGKNSED
jgi:hypothetical protein